AACPEVHALSLHDALPIYSVEKIRWEEDYRLTPAGLLLEEARVRGAGAGMDAPPAAVFADGSWRYRPPLPPLQPLRLSRSTTAGDRKSTRLNSSHVKTSYA